MPREADQHPARLARTLPCRIASAPTLFAAALLLMLALPALPAGRGDAPASGDPVRLELWTWALSPWFDDYIRDCLADFEAQHPGVSVRWIDVPGDAIVRKYFAAAAAGALPDVVNLPDKVFVRFASLGGLRAVDGLLPGDADAVFVPGALSQCRVGGRLVGLPWYLSTEICVMNRALLAEGGLDADALGHDWATILAQARQFHARTGRFLIILRLGGGPDLLGILFSDGRDVIAPHEQGGWRSNLLDPSIVATVRDWVDLFRSGALPRECATGEYAEMVQAYKDRRVAVINANALRAVRNDAPDVYAVTDVRPAITGASGLANIAAVQLAVTPQTRHPREAAALAWHLASPRWQTRLAVRASRLPSTLESLDDPAFAMPPDDAPDALQRGTAISARQLRGGAKAFLPPTGAWPDLERAFIERIKRALLEGRDVEATLRDIDREWNRMLRAEAAGMPWK